jgi:hypothetical protein
MADASLLKDYPGSTIQFTNARGAAADIDTSTKPLVVEFDDPAQAIITLDNIVRGVGKGKFSCDVKTLAEGGVTGKIRADRDMTPAGEDELVVPFAISVVDGPATGAAFVLSGGIDKPVTP